MTVSGTSPWLTWPFRPSRTASPAPSLSFRMRRLMHWRSKSPRSRTISKERRWLQKHTWQSSEQTASYHQGDDCFVPKKTSKNKLRKYRLTYEQSWVSRQACTALTLLLFICREPLKGPRWLSDWGRSCQSKSPCCFSCPPTWLSGWPTETAKWVRGP